MYGRRRCTMWRHCGCWIWLSGGWLAHAAPRQQGWRPISGRGEPDARGHGRERAECMSLWGQIQWEVMADQQAFLTRQGYAEKRQELEYLRTTKRQQVARRLHGALAEGELLENAELEDARNEQSFVEGRIMQLEALLSGVIIIEESDVPRDTVGLGSRITVAEGDGPAETYHLVGSAEADPMRGKVSNESPLGRALLGRKVGETAEVDAPDGVLEFRIVKIE